METEVIILGENATIKKKNPIKFVKVLMKSDGFTTPECSPSEYKHIELIARDFLKGYDLMFAYCENRNEGNLYIGYFNDGIV